MLRAFPGSSNLLIFLTLISLSSCAKMGYILEQGIGQFKLQFGSTKNEHLLSDPDVKEEVKEKVRLILKYKKHFYQFWGKPETNIYSRTTILDRKAVTHLVIASKHFEVKAKKDCFPIAGCFPYLGFFKEDSAKKYAKELEREDYVTYIRPVYAYSTLGNFEDRILSSFFHYSEFDLAELVFHELFHTIFFVKDEVELNENLANYFGQEMAFDYFKLSRDEIAKKIKRRKQSSDLSTKVVKLTKELMQRYEANAPKLKSESKKILDDFMTVRFKPFFERYCADNKVDYCFPLKRKWNNASLAALLTYEQKADQVKNLRQKLALNLKEFYSHLEKEYHQYDEGGYDQSFSDYLFKGTP